MKSFTATLSLMVVAYAAATTKYPSAVLHGMGDSCFNPGMKQITKVVGTVSGQYSVCVPGGSTQGSDTLSGFFVNMDKNVDIFAAKVRADPQLANGFNCVGFSQGNSVCRGYIHRYNDPPVITHLSVHGTVSGVAGFPNCNPDGLLGPVCKVLSHISGDVAYTDLQNDIFQVDYFRDPFSVNSTAFKEKSQLAQWNNEGITFNQTYKDNFLKVKRFAMIKAMKDTMVFPNEGEWWGHYADNSLSKVLTMKETKWYTDDLFGLKTADEAGRIIFNTTSGNHLQFSIEELTWWINNYFAE